MFNIGKAAKQFEAMPDNQVVESAMKAIRCWSPSAPNPVNYKFSRWGTDPYAFGSWSFIKAGSTPEDCETYFESDSTGGMVFFALLMFIQNILEGLVNLGLLPFLDIAQVGQIRYLLVGLVLMLLVIFRPQGLFGNKKEMQFNG